MTESLKITWHAARCSGIRHCDWSCLADEKPRRETCRFCGVHFATTNPSPTATAVSLQIDGTDVSCVAGTPLLEVLQGAGVEIPTLCHHPLLPPRSACRLCVVEISRSRDTQMIAACDYRVNEPISVRTDTPRIRRNRRILLELLLSEAPDAPKIRAMAARYGVDISTIPATETATRLPGCIVCGRCVAVCDQIIGCRAMDMTGRSADTHPSFPFDASSSEACTQCGACEAVCPTGALHIENAPQGAPVCDLCVQICPDAAISKSPDFLAVRIDDARCKECGLCIYYCPDKALHPSFSYDRK